MKTQTYCDIDFISCKRKNINIFTIINKDQIVVIQTCKDSGEFIRKDQIPIGSLTEEPNFIVNENAFVNKPQNK